MARLGRVVLAPYKIGSATAHDLAQELGIKRLRAPTRFQPGAMDCIVNWGCTPQSWVFNGTGFAHIENLLGVVNDPRQVGEAVNKLLSLNILQNAGVPCPEHTTDRVVAAQWRNEGSTVVCRSLLRGSGGRGITLVSGQDEIPTCPLYTRYVKKKREFRIHVMWDQTGGEVGNPYEVIHVQQKRKRNGVEHHDQIRNWDNGWVFCTRNIQTPEPVLTAAKQAVAALGLHFGAVDVGFNERAGTACVYEVNTAPNLTGETLQAYATAFRTRFGLTA